MLRITLRFYPVRIMAFTKNEIEMDITVENKGQEESWVETNVNLPEELSLSSEKKLRTGRLRVGIIAQNESKKARCKIYAGTETCPGMHKINVMGYSFNKEGVVVRKDETKTELRCSRIGEK